MGYSESGVYSHSGTLGAAIVVVPIVGLIAALLLGVAYAYVDVYSPIAGYVSLLFVAGFAFALGWTISKAGFLARCRSVPFLLVVGFLAGLVGLYTSWAAFEYALLTRYAEGFDGSLIGLFLSPMAVWELAKSINEEGWYNIRGMAPKGAVLWAFWGIEAIIVVGGAAFFAMMAIGDEVFCERCGQWTTKFSGKVRLQVPEDQTQLQDLAPHNLAPLEALQPASLGDNPHLRVDTWECLGCKDNPAIQLKVQSIVLDDKGKQEEKVEDVTPIWCVTSSDFGRLLALEDRAALIVEPPGATAGERG